MIRVLIVGLLGSVGGSGVGPYCKLINGTLGQNAQSLVTITSGDAINSVSSTVSLTTIADCCTACDNWLGFKPCAGFLFDPVEQICFLKAKLGVVLEDALSKTVVGFPAKQKYTLELVGQSPTEFVALKQISAVNTDKECCWHCLVMAECRSFKFNQTETNCQLGDVTTTDYQINIATDSANDFYQIDHNIEKQDTRKSRFLIIGGTNSSWNQDFTDEILQFIPEDRTLTAVGSSLLRRRNHISVLYKDRLINDGGILEYGTSNFFSAEFSQTEISLSADEPLSLVNLTKPFEASNLGCGGIIAQDYYYTCFGHSIPNQCHIYNLREGQNYTKVATVNMTEPARQRSTCVQIGSILYIIGGKRVSSNVTLNGETLTSVYQYNFDSGETRHLANLPTVFRRFLTRGDRSHIYGGGLSRSCFFSHKRTGRNRGNRRVEQGRRRRRRSKGT